MGRSISKRYADKDDPIFSGGVQMFSRRKVMKSASQHESDKAEVETVKPAEVQAEEEDKK